MSKHTPGPWTTNNKTVREDHGFKVYAFPISGNGQAIAAVWAGSVGKEAFGFDNQEANARLIAAAPDLLAALKDAANLIRVYDKGNPSDPTGWDNHELLDHWLAITDVIAKATGVPANQQYGVRVARARAAIAKAEGTS